MLKGAAGTGKTTLVAEFLKMLKESKRVTEPDKRPFALMAPTGRAAFIIGSKTNSYATTIHRGIYGLTKLRSTSQNKESEDDGGLHMRFGLRSNDDSEKTVYIVDEASMISDNFSENEAFSFGSGRLLSDLFQFARGRKIVFVGDYAQLPPVGMNFSPALDKEYIEQTFDCKVTEVILREVLRQSEGSVMLSNANAIRDRIEKKTFIEFHLDEGNDSSCEELDLLRPYYDLSASKPHMHSAIITYSNKQALQYNLAVRAHYYGLDAPRLKPGDLLMIARNNYAYDAELFNGNIVLVESCAPDSEVENRTVRVKLGKDKYEPVELRFRRTVLKFNAGGKACTVNARILDNFLDDPSGSIGGLTARALVVDFEKRLPLELKDALPLIKRLLRKNDKLSFEQEELYGKYLKLLFNDPYYNAVICKYGYAMTCHKAQGGEWKNVFVDMDRFGGTANEDYFRWAYTALTRASEKIWHFRSPDFNYISGLVVEPIQKSSNIKVSTYTPDGDFKAMTYHHIEKSARSLCLNVNEDTSRNYQHWMVFSNDKSESATIILWYNAKGYSGKNVIHSTSSEDFANLCMEIVQKGLLPADIPFESPGRPFAIKLVEYVRGLLDECGIILLDITTEAYQDVLHLKTDGYAKLCFYYTDKGNYTYLRPISSLGADDVKLEKLRKHFI